MKEKESTLLLTMLFMLLSSTVSVAQSDSDVLLKPRIVVLTDIAPANVELDDMESMVRLLVHADLFEIEALIASGGWNSSGGPYPKNWIDSLQTTIYMYEKDLPNLMKRSVQTRFLPIEKESEQQKIGYWPSSDYLKSRTMLGSLELGYQKIGKENDSPGSDFIIKLADENDPRPLWIAVWGGGNTLAQAIWKVQQQRTKAELKTFLNKLHVYTITDQDVPWGDRQNYLFSSHHWMRKEFGKDLFFIWDESAWLSQNSIGSQNWEEYATHIQNHGNLGRIYPKNKYGVEGDTPSFLYVIPNGLSNSTACNQVGWAGYFEWDTTLDKETYCYTNTTPRVKKISQKYERYFYPATFANFAARMDWANEGCGNRNPVVIINNQKGIASLSLSPKTGQVIKLDASKSFDPDKDELTFRWWLLSEAGTYTGDVKMINSDTNIVQVDVPDDAAGKTFHIICEVTDSGEHNLKSYRRIIFSPQ